MLLTNIEQTLLDLLQIDSATGDEKNILLHIESVLSQYNISFLRQEFEPDRWNILATKGGADTLLVAHVDTVPGEVSIKTEADRIYGRGACDNKQSVANNLELLINNNNIHALFTVDEEIGLSGAKAFAESSLNIYKHAIIQEPTNFEIYDSQNGIFEVQIMTTGTAVHSSSEVHDSAINKLLDMLMTIRSKGWSYTNIGLIKGGEASNTVPSSASANILFRPTTLDEIKEIREYFETLKGVQVVCDLPPVQGWFNNNKAEFGSEACFFDKPLIFGAGDIANAHTDSEFILRSELNELPIKTLELIKTL